jgi:hypothetical protein
VLAVGRTDLQRLEPKIGESADVNIIYVRMCAYFFVGREKDSAVLRSELLTVFRVDVCAGYYLKTDVFVGLSVFVGDGSRSYDSNAHV